MTDQIKIYRAIDNTTGISCLKTQWLLKTENNELENQNAINKIKEKPKTKNNDKLETVCSFKSV